MERFFLIGEESEALEYYAIILNLKDPASFIIQYILGLYRSLNWGPSDPVAHDMPMCHRASPYIFCYNFSHINVF